jgi:hypothetical protein
MSDPPRPDPATPTAPTPATGWGRAYRAGRLVCARVQVTIGHDDRLGLTRRERRYVRARFQAERLDRALRTELIGLLRRRGAAGYRMAERIAPIELVIDAPGGCHRVVGRLQPPLLRHGRLRDIEFGLRELEPTR